MRVGLDTNILAYAEGIDGVERRDATLTLLRELQQETVVIPAQVLGELFNVLVRKAGRTRAKARNALLSWRDAFPIAETSPDVIARAADLATDHQLGIWDAIVLSTVAQAGCRLLLSEDLQNGFVWSGVTVVDPFASPRTALLDAVLASSP